MTKTPALTPAQEQFLLTMPHAIVATIRKDGTPQLTPTWYLWDGGRVLVNMEDTRKRLANLRRDPRVSITVMGDDDWYHQVTLRGVISLEDDPDYEGAEDIVADIAKAPAAMTVAREHQHGQHDGVADIGYEMCGVQPEQHPEHGSIGIGVPIDVQRRKLEPAHHERQDAQNRHSYQPPADLAQVAGPGPAVEHLV